MFSRKKNSTPESAPEQSLADAFSANNSEGEAASDWGADFEGQLAVDVYETTDELVIKAPIAGVAPEDLDIQIGENQVTIHGERQDSHQLDADNFFFQECYWGGFSRTVPLPFIVDVKKATAAIKHGLLTIKLPKDERTRSKKLEVKLEA